ncbi:hypothetical protein ACF0H5_004667 [Mactra antiquata]
MESKCLNVLVLFFAGIAICSAQSDTSTPKPERFEFESFVFNFDGNTGLVTVHQKDECYLWPVTDDEHNQVHTDEGMRRVELRIITEIDDALYTVVPKAILNPTLIRSCSFQAKHFYLVH